MNGLGFVPLVAALVCLTPGPQGFKQGKIDPSTVPITKAELESGLRASVNDVDDIITYLRRAERFELRDDAFDVVKELHKKYPRNTTVASAYLFAYAIAARGYNTHIPHDRPRNFNIDERMEFAKLVKEATKLKPPCYLAFIESGDLEAYNEAHKLQDRRSALSDMRRALQLAPDSGFACYRYAAELLLFAQAQPSPEGVEYATRAVNADPPVADAALQLYYSYKYRLNDPAKAEQAKITYLSLLDRRFQIPADTKKLLGIK